MLRAINIAAGPTASSQLWTMLSWGSNQSSKRDRNICSLIALSTRANPGYSRARWVGASSRSGSEWAAVSRSPPSASSLRTASKCAIRRSCRIRTRLIHRAALPATVGVARASTHVVASGIYRVFHVCGLHEGRPWAAPALGDANLAVCCCCRLPGRRTVLVSRAGFLFPERPPPWWSRGLLRSRRRCRSGEQLGDVVPVAILGRSLKVGLAVRGVGRRHGGFAHHQPL
jgi:hypothetical protein